LNEFSGIFTHTHTICSITFPVRSDANDQVFEGDLDLKALSR